MTEQLLTWTLSIKTKTKSVFSHIQIVGFSCAKAHLHRGAYNMDNMVNIEPVNTFFLGHSASFEPESPTSFYIMDAPQSPGTYYLNDFHVHFGGVTGRSFELQVYIRLLLHEITFFVALKHYLNTDPNCFPPIEHIVS